MTPSQSTRRFRCSECGRTDGLTAIAYGYMMGTLGEDGRDLADFSLAAESTELCEDTIECPDHLGAAIHKRIDGVWCRWEGCKTCRATGRVPDRYRRFGGEQTCGECNGVGGHDVPVEEVAGV